MGPPGVTLPEVSFSGGFFSWVFVYGLGKYTSPIQQLWLGIHSGEAYGPHGPW